MNHGHDVDATGLRRWLLAVVAAVTVCAATAMVIWWPTGPGPELNPGVDADYVDATITRVTTEDCSSVEIEGVPTGCRRISATVTSGPTEGDVAQLLVFDTDFDVPDLNAGDDVVLRRNLAVDPSIAYSFVDFQRSTPLLLLAGLFVVVVVAFGGIVGVRALAGVAVSFAVIFAFLLPSLLRGNPAVGVAMAATVAIAVAALYLAHGLRASTTVALVGTLAALVVVAALAHVFVSLTSLSGLASAEGEILRVADSTLDLQALLVAGIVVGALGVIDDVTVTQVSAVAELQRADPDRPRWQLYRAAIRIGRDHIASTVNTLVLAYAGASLPLLLVFLQGDQPWHRVATGEAVAMEIIRTLAGSIGLVLAVPITTALACVALLAPDTHADSPTPDATGAGDGDWGAFAPEASDF
ncbi:MAG: YibE/F family protein [Acidimicrobiales bacterium]|jgi:uncharacterized membrane protein|nr:YibE/F family protein [Acidimicrobiales bacterium]